MIDFIEKIIFYICLGLYWLGVTLIFGFLFIIDYIWDCFKE